MFLVRGRAHSVRFSYGARGNFQAVLLLQPPRHDEKLHNAPATTATAAPAKAASDGRPSSQTDGWGVQVYKELLVVLVAHTVRL